MHIPRGWRSSISSKMIVNLHKRAPSAVTLWPTILASGTCCTIAIGNGPHLDWICRRPIIRSSSREITKMPRSIPIIIVYGNASQTMCRGALVRCINSPPAQQIDLQRLRKSDNNFGKLLQVTTNSISFICSNHDHELSGFPIFFFANWKLKLIYFFHMCISFTPT